ncbi:MAG: hypothetical protein NT007_13775, partial [Candidatus Kapabacteria bacterium]|nr:hypothetical protein [Candidatus Kapabacteria bacterium]
IFPFNAKRCNPYGIKRVWGDIPLLPISIHYVKESHNLPKIRNLRKVYCNHYVKYGRRFVFKERFLYPELRRSYILITLYSLNDPKLRSSDIFPIIKGEKYVTPSEFFASIGIHGY